MNTGSALTGQEWQREEVVLRKYRFRRKERVFIEGVIVGSSLYSGQNELHSPLPIAPPLPCQEK